MSAKKDLYVAMSEYLMSRMQIKGTGFPDGLLAAEMNLPGLKWFDKQMGQFTHPELSYAIPLPGILMQYMPFQWTTVGKRQQRGAGILRFSLYFENYADSFNGSVNSDIALRFFEYSEVLHQALQGLLLDGITTTALDRVGDNEDEAEDMIVTTTMDYSVVLADAAADYSRNYEMANADVVVEKVRATSRPGNPTFTDGFVLPGQQ